MKVSVSLSNVVIEGNETGITRSEGTLQGKVTYTAWELCGDWWWTEKYHCRIVGGRSIYWEATATRATDGRVRLAYLDAHAHEVRRYVDGDTEMELIPQETQGQSTTNASYWRQESSA